MHDTLIYNPEDTICAISTPHGSGGVAIIRVSGRKALDIVAKLWKGRNLNTVDSHTVHLGKINDYEGNTLDEVLLTLFKNPSSFTGEDVIELGVHGSRWIQSRLIQSLIDAGCRLALPGEFTQRAFRTGKIDLAQAEGIADLIASSSKAAHRLAMSQMRGTYSNKIETMRQELLQLASLLELELDFSEEDVEFASRSQLLKISDKLAIQLQNASDSFRQGHALKDGIPIAIIGRTNAGKSSLLNTLLGDDKAIVSDIHGTTRDIVEDTIELGDYKIRLQDTAGLRKTKDPIEQIGIERTKTAAKSAGLVLFVVDISSKGKPETQRKEIDIYNPKTTIILLNKCDVAIQFNIKEWEKAYPDYTILPCSAATEEGIARLKETITEKITSEIDETDIIVANARHAHAFDLSAQYLRQFTEALRNNIPSDLAAQDLREAIHHLSSITGSITTPEILNNIFSHFCVGK